MLDFLAKLFDTSDFPARWHCGRWSASHGWLHVLSDLAIFAAYVTIPLVLSYFLLRRRDLPFPRIFWLFSLFIVSCGVAHLIEAGLFWYPMYRLSGLAKAATAFASWATVLALIPIVPQVLSLRSPLELEQAVETRTRDLARANSQLRDFGTWISHDLRTPLRHLEGYVSLLRRPSSDPERREHYLASIEGAAAEMREMIDGLLQLSRLGEDELEHSDADIDELVASIRAELAPACQGRRVEWVVGHLPRIRADGRLLRHALLNVLDNAVKYSSQREIARIEVSAVERPGETEIVVSDNGVGFDPAFAGKAFGLFQRLHVSREFAGLGVGLAVAATVVERHGGRIWADSSVGSGAQFHIVLPRPTA